MNRERLYEIDNMYALGTILVVLGHSHPSDWSMIAGTPYEKIITFIYLFHMPLFFCIAGLLMYKSKHMKRTKKSGYFCWILEKGKKLLIPYIFLQAIAIIPKYYVENHSLDGIVNSIQRALIYPRDGIWGHLWFLPVLFALYAVMGLGLYYTEKTRKIYVVSATIISLILYFLQYESKLFGITDIMNSAIFFSFGMLIAMLDEKFATKHKKANSAVLFVLLIATAAAIYRNPYACRATNLLIGIIMIMACLCFATFIGPRKFLEIVGKNNYTIYLYSWITQATVMYICIRLGTNAIVMGVCMFVVGFAGPAALLLIYKKQNVIKGSGLDILLGIKKV